MAYQASLPLSRPEPNSEYQDRITPPAKSETFSRVSEATAAQDQREEIQVEIAQAEAVRAEAVHAEIVQAEVVKDAEGRVLTALEWTLSRARDTRAAPVK